MDVDLIQLKLVENYRFQILSFIALGIVYARGAWNVFGVLFLAAGAGHTCDYDREIVTVESKDSNQHVTTIFNASSNFTVTTVSWGLDGKKSKDPLIVPRECDVIVAGENGTNLSMPCTFGWVYRSEFESTIVSEWDLVCVRAYLSELSTTLYMVGSMVGAFLISPLSDKFGRRIVLLLCLMAQAVVGACVALSPNYAVFTTLRFIVGFFNMGIALCTYVMMTEIFPAQHRAIPSCGFQIFWAFGVMLTALFGFVVRDWRHLQLVFSLPNILCAVFVWIMPESLPWLISQNKLSKAQSVIARIARFNNLDIPDDFYMYEASQVNSTNDQEDIQCNSPSSRCADQPLLSEELSQQEAVGLLSEGSSHELRDREAVADKQNGHAQAGDDTSQTGRVTTPERIVDSPAIDPEVQIIAESTPGNAGFQQSTRISRTRELKNVFTLCTSPRIRLYTIIMFFLFFVNSLSYFGISLSTPVLHGNQFFNLFLLGAVEIPAYVICILVCERVGRKVPLCVFLLTCGVMNITAMMISDEASSGMSGVKIGFVMLGKFAITGAYTTVYLYSAEIFPTCIRNHAVGISSCFENFGSIAAPFIVFSAKSHPEFPMILFGIVSVIGGLMTLFMPETHRRPLPQTIEEVESWGICKRRRTE
ncbi:solute carrier family 22 member 5 [Aplysia californica]|uniref:Solute carrier family 22 member 5 n=1 Tax=Aplysia californica TaxID=6500 RepID=A0ABM0JBC3_APLCA|nr:solute carrier family 22 member 5 [Aplysia californica]XP_012937668.1 solute carrier family 22 member 5 [Aplysia californica]